MYSFAVKAIPNELFYGPGHSYNMEITSLIPFGSVVEFRLNGELSKLYARTAVGLLVGYGKNEAVPTLNHAHGARIFITDREVVINAHVVRVLSFPSPCLERRLPTLGDSDTEDEDEEDQTDDHAMSEELDVSEEDTSHTDQLPL